MKRLLIPVLLLLAACGTPQERCISRNTKDLQVVNGLIAEAEGNLGRGYALEEYRTWDEVLDWCQAPPPPPGPNGELRPAPPPQPCYRRVAVTETRPKKIDLVAEANQLQQLRKRQAELEQRAKSVIAQCQALYPETEKK